MDTLTISGSPHVFGGQSVKKIMYGVVIAMIPAMLVSLYFFGFGALRVILVSVVSCLIFEYLIQKHLMKLEPTINDGSAVVTGILLAFNLPSNLPVWIILVGALVAIGIGKMSFGGLGKNPFNPALVGRVFLLISFPVQMTSWPVPKPVFSSALTDAVTGPTPLGLIKDGLKLGKTVPEIMSDPTFPDYIQTLIGNHGGSLGEMSAIALILGGIYMLIRKIITWEIPVAYIGSVVIFTGIFWLIDPTYYADPLFHLLTGGMMLGVFFMATDMVSSPMSRTGQLIYGVGCGVLTILIRIWGAYPEGVSFAILIMNAFVPLLNKYIKPKRFGEVVKHG
ncbi:MAG: RnfABCDGE type electron transport complex subunit D [Bacteroidales bacterium]|jgi:electron transport complex protein RnfD|nr:RnfABCDGE type electron transport complex subunit D [Bacteroidales bacterium]